MSIQSQTMFWKNSVCDLPNNLAEQSEISQEYLTGMNAFTDLLRTIYADYEAFEFSTAPSTPTKIGILQDDLENYHHLTDTTLCLYCLALAGTVCQEGEAVFLTVDKAMLKQIFKKPAQKYFELLGKYQFAFEFYKQNKAAKSFASADTVRVYYHRIPELLFAMKHLSDRVPKTDVKKDYAPGTTIFAMADYDTMLLGKGTSRSEFSPLHPSILNVLADKRDIWERIIGRLHNELGLDTDVSVNTYVFPTWTIIFIHKKKTVCTFHIRSNQICLRLPLAYEVAKDLIDVRETLPASMQTAMQSFGCVHCGKCLDSSNIEEYEGYRLCRLSYHNFITEDARIIQLELTREDEINAVSSIVKKLI